MRGSIRTTDVAWDPEHQSRQAVWKHIKAHIESELARIEAASKHHVRRRRLLESPNFHRDRAILHEHEVQGIALRALARKHGLSQGRIREIIRMARHRERILPVTPRLPQPPVTELTHRGLPNLPGGPPHTRSLMKDP